MGVLLGSQYQMAGDVPGLEHTSVHQGLRERYEKTPVVLGDSIWGIYSWLGESRQSGSESVALHRALFTLGLCRPHWSGRIPDGERCTT